jgi:outer membrane protein insertion porin family
MSMGVWVRRGLVVAGLLLGLGCVGFTAGVTHAAPSSETGASADTIIVEGNRRVEADTVRSYFKVAPGEHLDDAKINAAIKALYASGLFQDVKISRQGGHVVVTVIEAAVIDRLQFEGNRRLKDEQLQEEIQSKARDSLSRAKVQADTQRIIEVYQRSGRFDVSVVPKIIERPNNRVDLIFEINEGEKTGVKTIVIVGNKSYSAWRLKEVIKTSESNFLTFLQTTDVYDPDRIEADRDLIRRFYLKHGFADVQVVSATGEYDPAKKGFIITFTIEEGPVYRFGTIDVQSNVRAVDSQSLKPQLLTHPHDLYNGEAIEKTVEDITVEVARRGYPFANVRPRGDRNPQTRTINVAYVVDEGTRAYIERINIRGNIRTRDYVIRRELDIAEGDPYNRALMDRAERRIKNLNYFKSVKVTNEPGSAPDRVVINVNVEEQSTGDFSIMGGYSTAEGWLAQVSVSERNLLGTGRFAKASATYGEYVRGVEFDYAEPYFLDQRVGAGISLFAKETLANSYLSYGTESYGGTLKFSIPLREDFAVQTRYSLYTQKITLPYYLDDCNNINPDFANTFASPAAIASSYQAAGLTPSSTPPPTPNPNYPGYNSNAPLTCFSYGQASLPVRVELANGTTVTSSVGYGLTYNTLDNNKSPTNGLLVSFGQDYAGLGGDVDYIRSTVDFHSYYEVVPDLVGIVHLQAGNMFGLNDGGEVRLLDDFKMGPNLVRGFAPAGIGPRDVTIGTSNDALGGTSYWGASLEFQYPFYFLPKDSGFRGAVFVDSGSEFGYKGETSYAATGEINGLITPTTGPSFVCQCGMQYVDDTAIRASAGASLIWDSPFGPLRFDFAYPFLRKYYDRTQFFAFGGGTHF